MFVLFPSVITIEIPALDRYLQYQKEQDGLQQKVDALTAKIATSDAALASSMEKENV